MLIMYNDAIELIFSFNFIQIVMLNCDSNQTCQFCNKERILSISLQNSFTEKWLAVMTY